MQLSALAAISHSCRDWAMVVNREMAAICVNMIVEQNHFLSNFSCDISVVCVLVLRK